MIARLLAVLLLILAPGCAKDTPSPEDDNASEVRPPITGSGVRRADGRIATPTGPRPVVSLGTQEAGGAPVLAAGEPSGPGEFSLNFADTDVREVVAQLLGGMLRVNYTIDPGVKGSVTLRTARALSRAELLPALQAMLAQNGATLIQSGGLYRIAPATGAAGSAGAGTGGTVVPLRYASAEELSKVLQPYVGQGGKVIADPGRNALLIAAEGEARDSLLGLIQAFDIDMLAGQSYALLPVTSGGVKDLAHALQESFRVRGGGLAGAVRVVAMERVNAVLVVAPRRDDITAARRVYETVDRARRQIARSWYIHYLQNGQVNDVAYMLQQAFTPHNVTAVPNAQSGRGGQGRGSLGSGGAAVTSGIGGGGGGGIGATAGGGLGAGSPGGALGGGGAGGGAGLGGAGGANEAGGAPGGPAASAQGNPLLGGLDVMGQGQAGGAAGGGTVDGMRIIANDTNNALMIYATLSEHDSIRAMMRKLDIMPLQVRIDATIAEVTLNDTLKYGTQYFFKSGGINSILSFAPVTMTTPALTPLNTSFPGFFIGGPNQGGAPLAISALQAVTQVNVLSSPQLMVLDNQSAKLQVGSLVPYLTQTSQSTLTANAPVINSVNYQQTGVIMQITPRVNSGGLVTLDIAQEVSEVDTNTAQTTTGINSPTFQNRNVVSRVVVQDGQTIGLAGLIRDNTARGNQGIPFLKDIPILGFLTGRQTNERVRTELIVLITPHVMYDQRDARLLTQDLREQLVNAAAVPRTARDIRTSGSADPGEKIRRAIRP